MSIHCHCLSITESVLLPITCIQFKRIAYLFVVRRFPSVRRRFWIIIQQHQLIKCILYIFTHIDRFICGIRFPSASTILRPATFHSTPLAIICFNWGGQIVPMFPILLLDTREELSFIIFHRHRFFRSKSTYFCFATYPATVSNRSSKRFLEIQGISHRCRVAIKEINIARVGNQEL